MSRPEPGGQPVAGPVGAAARRSPASSGPAAATAASPHNRPRTRGRWAVAMRRLVLVAREPVDPAPDKEGQRQHDGQRTGSALARCFQSGSGVRPVGLRARCRLFTRGGTNCRRCRGLLVQPLHRGRECSSEGDGRNRTTTDFQRHMQSEGQHPEIYPGVVPRKSGQSPGSSHRRADRTPYSAGISLIPPPRAAPPCRIRRCGGSRCR